MDVVSLHRSSYSLLYLCAERVLIELCMRKDKSTSALHSGKKTKRDVATTQGLQLQSVGGEAEQDGGGSSDNTASDGAPIIRNKFLRDTKSAEGGSAADKVTTAHLRQRTGADRGASRDDTTNATKFPPGGKFETNCSEEGREAK